MGIVVRQSFQTVIITYAGIALGFANTLWLFPLILSEEQIGLTRTLINAAILFATFASMGSASIPVRFFPYFKNAPKAHGGFLFFLLMLGTAGFLVFCVAFFALQSPLFSIYGTKAPLLIDYSLYVVPFVGIVLMWNIFETYTNVHQLSVVPSFVREVMIRLLFTVGLLLLLFELLNFTLFIRWIIGAYIVALMTILIYLRSQKILFLKPDLSVVGNERFKEMLVFGGFITAANVGGSILANIDGLMLSAYAGLKSTGIYSIAFYIGVLVEVPKRALSLVLVPIVSEANKNNDTTKLKELYRKSSLNQLIVGGLIFLGIWCNIDDIFQVIPKGDLFIQGKWVVFFIGIGKLLDMAMGINAEIIGTSRYYKIDLLFFCFLSIFGFAGNLVFIPLFGMTGAAIASAISIFLFNSMRFVFIALKYNMQPFSFGTIKVLGIAAVVVAVNRFFPTLGSPIADVILRSALIAFLFGGLVTGLKVSGDINAALTKGLHSLRSSFQ